MIGHPLFYVFAEDYLKEEFEYMLGGFHIDTSSNGEKSIVPAG